MYVLLGRGFRRLSHVGCDVVSHVVCSIVCEVVLRVVDVAVGQGWWLIVHEVASGGVRSVFSGAVKETV